MKEISFEKLNKELNDEGKTTSVVRSRGSAAVPPLRTFSHDVESMVRDGGITKTQVVMAEESRRESRGEIRTVHGDDGHLTRIIFFLLLVLAFAIGVGLYVLIGVTPKPVIETREDQPKTERMYEVNITDSPREQIIADIAVAFSKTSYKPSESRVVAFTTVNGEKRARDATAAEILSALAHRPIPETLARSLRDPSVFRIHGQNIALPLYGSIEFTTRSYPNSFVGMLEWEKSMARDLIVILDPKFPRSMLLTLEERPFSDVRVSGIDLRVLRTPDGQTVLAYVFVNEERLIIAKNESILSAMVEEGAAVSIK